MKISSEAPAGRMIEAGVTFRLSPLPVTALTSMASVFSEGFVIVIWNPTLASHRSTVSPSLRFSEVSSAMDNVVDVLVELDVEVVVEDDVDVVDVVVAVLGAIV